MYFFTVWLCQKLGLRVFLTSQWAGVSIFEFHASRNQLWRHHHQSVHAANETSDPCCLWVHNNNNNNNDNMFISYSWYNNEMVQIQMENMPKNYNTHASYKNSTQSDEGTYSLVLQKICIFDITVQLYLITRNFPNQIRQFGWIKYWQVITIVFTCSELFYRSYSITCFNINSAGSVFAQIIIGAIP